VWTGGDETRPAKASPERVSFAALIAGWASEKRPSEKTLYSWQRVFDRLASFVGHRDAARLSPMT